MVSDPIQPRTNFADEPSSGLQAQLEKAHSEGVQLRREALRWKMLAKQHEDRLKEIESSATWRLFGIVRILPELRHRWKLLLLVGILGFISLPFLPLLAILMCFASGRDLIWRVLWKIQPLHDLMGFVRQNILTRIGSARGEVSDVRPLIYHRPVGVESPAKGITSERLCWLLLEQLCPQRRLLLQDFGLTRNSLIKDEEIPDLLSLSRTEMSLLKISVGNQPAMANRSVYSQ